MLTFGLTYERVDVEVELLGVMEVWVYAGLVKYYLRYTLVKQLEILRSIDESEED